MARQTLGLYWDDVQIQLCLLRSATAERSIESLACFRRELGEAGRPANDILIEIGAIKEELGLTIDTCAVALAEQELMYRQVSRPFGDRRKIAATLPAELETLLPLSDEQFVCDFVLTGKDSEGHNRVLSAAARRKPVADLIAALKSAALEPEMVAVPACALAAGLKAYYDLDAERNYIGLHLGWRETSLAVIEQGRLSHIGGLPFGFGDLAGAADRGDQALNTATELSEGELKPLLREVMLKIERLDINPAEYRLLCCGFKVTSLPQLLAEASGIDITSTAPLQVDDAPQCEALMALGLAQLALDPDEAVDLRQGELAFTRKLERMRGYAGRLIKAAAAVLLLWTAGVTADIILLNHRAHELDKRTAVVFNASMPPGTPMVEPLKQMQQRLNSVGSGSVSADQPLDLLRAISAAVPKELDVDIADLAIDEGTVNLSGATSSYENVEKIKASLAGLPHITEVKVLSANPDQLSGRVDFKLSLTRGGGA